MGKTLQNGDLVMRDEKVAFYEIPGQYAFIRMEGFTSMSTSKSATEHSRKYVDERSTRSDVVGYEESISYSFDRYDGNAVQDDIVTITDEEKVGKQATRRIIQVDMKTLSEDGTTASGRMRSYSVVPDSNGDDANVLTYSGNLKNNGEWENVTVTSSDDWQTCALPIWCRGRRCSGILCGYQQSGSCGKRRQGCHSDADIQRWRNILHNSDGNDNSDRRGNCGKYISDRCSILQW